MNPILEQALRSALALLPANLPDEIARVLGAALAHMIEELVRRHTADPDFGSKMQAWIARAEAAKGGTADDQAKASADLWALMGQ